MPPVSQQDDSSRLLGWMIPAGLALLSGALFASTLSDAIQIADSGEMVAAACNFGVAHPPGYPLYMLLGNLLCRLPLSTPAGRVGVLSLLSGVLGVLAVYGIVRRTTDSRWAAATAALVLATGSLFWRYASLAEVFALHVALALGVVYAVVRASGAETPRGRLCALGAAALLFGLGMSNNHSTVLLGPLLALVVLQPFGGPAAFTARLGVCAAGFAVGLLPYLALLHADPLALPRWGDTSNWAGLLHHVLRRDYGTLRLSIAGGAGPFSAPLAFFAALPKQLGWVLFPFAFWGVVLCFARASGRPLAGEVPGTARRPLMSALGAAPLLCGPFFLLLLNIPVEGIGRQVVERFFLLPIALLVLTLGVGLAWLERRLRAEKGRGGPWKGVIAAVLALVCLGSYGRADVSSAYAVEDYAINALASAERGALILGRGDVRLFAFLYVQRVLGLRKDVQYVDPKLLLYPWYVEQQRWLYPGFAYRHRPKRVDSLAAIQGELRRGRAVYLATIYNQRVATAFGSYPAGPLLRVVDPQKSAPDLAAVLRLNARLFRGFTRRGRSPDPQVDPWSASLREPFAKSWLVIAKVLHRNGALQPARRALRRGAMWAPWLRQPAWAARGAARARGGRW